MKAFVHEMASSRLLSSYIFLELLFQISVHLHHLLLITACAEYIIARSIWKNDRPKVTFSTVEIQQTNPWLSRDETHQQRHSPRGIVLPEVMT
jgi:hypothetical protein